MEETILNIITATVSAADKQNLCSEVKFVEYMVRMLEQLGYTPEIVHASKDWVFDTQNGHLIRISMSCLKDIADAVQKGEGLSRQVASAIVTAIVESVQTVSIVTEFDACLSDLLLGSK